MELSECIRGRRSVREYLDQPVEKDKIESILNAAAMAPSARDTQQWRFTVIEDKSEIKRLSDEAKKNMGLLGRGLGLAESMTAGEDVIFYNAPLLIIVSAKRDDKWAKVDCGIAAQNMMLSAYGMGLGSCYVGLANSLNNSRRVLADLGLPQDYEIVAPVVFGYPRKWPQPVDRKPTMLKWVR